MPHAQNSSLVVSSLDLARLEQLLDSPAYAESDSATRLGEELARARVLPPAEMPADVVTMNSRVTCVEEISGKEHHLTLVYPKAADAASGKISVLAPIGAALLGLSVGQSIDWSTPGGQALRVRVASISYQPEAAGDLTS